MTAALSVCGQVASADRAVPTTLDAAIHEVATAKDAVAANDAYSRGLVMAPDSMPLQQTYIRRMVDLGVPRAAYAAAQRLLVFAPGDGLAWAVSAYEIAAQGNMLTAIADISIAAHNAPGEPFVQRTAGQLLAWYDNAPRPSQDPEVTVNALTDIRQEVGSFPAFAGAYREAGDFYAKQKAVVAREQTWPTGAAENEGPLPTTNYYVPPEAASAPYVEAPETAYAYAPAGPVYGMDGYGELYYAVPYYYPYYPFVFLGTGPLFFNIEKFPTHRHFSHGVDRDHGHGLVGGANVGGSVIASSRGSIFRESMPGVRSFSSAAPSRMAVSSSPARSSGGFSHRAPAMVSSGGGFRGGGGFHGGGRR